MKQTPHRPGIAASLLFISIGLSLSKPPTVWSQQRLLQDVSEELGVRVENSPPGEPPYFMPTIMGSGVAWLDADGDGRLDLYFPRMGAEQPNRLLLQDADGTFSDASQGSGADHAGFGMGVAVGDVDNDSRVDLYLTNYGPDALLMNESTADGVRFVTETLSDDERWSSSATMCDFDADGWLDIYVTHYVELDEDKACFAPDGRPDFCSPQVFPGASDALYRNLSGKGFADVTDVSGIGAIGAPGLGVVCADFNQDGRLDFYVANDGAANQLWIQQADHSFVDEAILAGVALNAFGAAEAGMGVAIADADADADLDLFVTHLGAETNTYYQNEEDLTFEDRSAAAGLGASSLPFTGFGTGFADLNHDGWLDLLIVNGRVQWQPAGEDAPGVEARLRPYAEPNQLFLGNGSGGFDRGTDSAWLAYLEPVEVSRGLALADMDDDGDIDLVVANTGSPARLYRNATETPGAWLSVRARTPSNVRDAHSATITAVTNRGKQSRLSGPGYGYLSSHDPRAHFTFTAGTELRWVEVLWPGGLRESFPSTGLGRTIEVIRGQGETLAAAGPTSGPGKTERPRDAMTSDQIPK